MEIVAIIAVLVVLIGVPVVAVNRDLIFHRSALKRTPVEPPLPFLIIPSYLGAADLVPSGTSRQHPPAWPREVRAPDARAQDARAENAQSLSAEPDHREAQHAAPEPEEAQDVPQEIPLRADLAEGWDDTFGGSVDSEDSEFDDSFEDADDHAIGLIETDETEELSPDATVIFHRPVDEPMQILPGRLRIISGEPGTDDLRLFSRLGEPPRIVVGRDSGPPHRHITLHSPTVSRRHARMDFENGVWTITNLSQTNPVLVNDRVLGNGNSARKLSDGDRIELGEVALRFLSS